MLHQLTFRLFLATALILLLPTLCLSETLDFETWLAELRIEAKAAGISPQTLNIALTGIQPLPRIIKLDRHQPESRKTLEQYLGILITKQRKDTGIQKLQVKKKFFHDLKEIYGVPGPILVSLWGIESNFGTNTGNVPVIAALATLAHDPRRSSFFRSELLDALKLLDQNVVKLDTMQGSWAGAMGQLQFLPSVLLRFKVDANQDGSIHIWQDSPDLFSTAANYLAQSGWHAGKPWGFEVDPSQVPNEMPLSKMTRYQPLNWWKKTGIKTISGPFPENNNDKARLILPEGTGGRAFLVMENFEVLLTWNRSNLYALAVGLLSDKIAGN